MVLLWASVWASQRRLGTGLLLMEVPLLQPRPRPLVMYPVTERAVSKAELHASDLLLGTVVRLMDG